MLKKMLIATSLVLSACYFSATCTQADTSPIPSSKKSPKRKHQEIMSPRETPKRKKQEIANFFDAIQQGDLDRVNAQIQTNATLVNTKNANDSTPLIEAVTSGNMPIIQSLIDAGASINAQGVLGVTALVAAAQNNNPSPTIIQALINAGAHVDEKTMSDEEYGIAPLFAFIDNNMLMSSSPDAQLAEKILTILLGAGADINTRCGGFTPLDLVRFKLRHQPDNVALLKIVDILTAIAAL